MEKLMVKTNITVKPSKINFSIRISILYSSKHGEKDGIEKKIEIFYKKLFCCS